MTMFVLVSFIFCIKLLICASQPKQPNQQISDQSPFDKIVLYSKENNQLNEIQKYKSSDGKFRFVDKDIMLGCWIMINISKKIIKNIVWNFQV